MSEINLGPLPVTILNVDDAEVITDGAQAIQPLTLTQRTRVRAHRGAPFVSDDAIVLVHGAERAKRIREVMGDEYGMDL